MSKVWFLGGFLAHFPFPVTAYHKVKIILLLLEAYSANWGRELFWLLSM
jgi:hypothetical protein